ncbi:hypothetical protein [Actinomadura alba]|uniref:Uncharacterized protein n=1 Tax=Actinomadura alba TaxID=406431 RepID=A0ABR7LNW6_9ACTN|nr:hypothetical protein [Actinomadura alba]MBC6466550.1 hypothetical protein [Actinomadura alba]
MSITSGEDSRCDLADTFGIGDCVDLGDLAVGDSEAHHGERLPRTVTTNPGGCVHQRRVEACGRQGAAQERLQGDSIGAADTGCRGLCPRCAAGP